MNKKNPQISILLPTYNRPELLKDAIESVLNQTYTNFELIISNNCSPNPEVDIICREYAAKDSRIRYFCQEKNIGCEKNTRFCISKMQNNLHFGMSDDDIIAPEFIEKCIQKLQNTKGAVGCWSKIKYIDEDRVEYIDKNNIGSNADLTSNNPIDNIIKWTMLKHWMGGGVFDYSIIKDCDTHYKKVFGWDVLLTSQILLLGKIARVEEPLYTYQIRTKSEDIKQITESNQKDFNEFSVISSDLDIIMRTFELVFETDKLNVFQKIEFYFKMWFAIFTNKYKIFRFHPTFKFINLIEEKKLWKNYFYFLPYILIIEIKRLKFLLFHPFLIFHKIKQNTVLLINNGNSSGKELLNYAQYFTNQGYNVDILSRMSHKKYLKNKKGIKVLKIKDKFSKFYETRMIKKYEFIVSVFNPINTYPFLNLCNKIRYIEEFITEEQEVNV